MMTWTPERGWPVPASTAVPRTVPVSWLLRPPGRAPSATRSTATHFHVLMALNPSRRGRVHWKYETSAGNAGGTGGEGDP